MTRRPPPPSEIVAWARRSVSQPRRGTPPVLGHDVHDQLQSIARLDQPPRDTLVGQTVKLLRDANAVLHSEDTTDYDQGLAQRSRVAELTTHAAATLASRVTPSSPHRAAAIDALLDGLTHPLQGWCHPECCGAAGVRYAQFVARGSILVAARRLDTHCGTQIDRDLVRQLLCESPQRVAVPMADLLWRCPDACRLHEDALLAGLDCRHWPVVELCVRGLGTITSLQRKPPFVPLLRHERWQIRQSAVRALTPRALSPRMRERLEQLQDTDPHPGVRILARARLGATMP